MQRRVGIRFDEDNDARGKIVLMLRQLKRMLVALAHAVAPVWAIFLGSSVPIVAGHALSVGDPLFVLVALAPIVTLILSIALLITEADRQSNWCVLSAVMLALQAFICLPSLLKLLRGML